MGEWTKVTLNIWRTIRTSFGMSKCFLSTASIGYLNDFTPSHTDAGFKKWSQYRLRFLHQMFHSNALK